jgi:hypothetical protein
MLITVLTDVDFTGIGSKVLPHALQKAAPSLFSAPHFGQNITSHRIVTR